MLNSLKINEIAASIQNKNLAVFCGAGISVNSGVPSVVKIVNYILRQLEVEEEDIKSLVNEKNLNSPFKFAFEMFIEQLLQACKEKSLFELFEIYNTKNLEPNNNHIFFAKLAKQGLLKIIFTTNFDTLIEKALKKEDVAYRVIYQSKDFEKINEEPNKVKIIKLHGDYGDGSEHYKKSIVSTIEKISRENQKYKQDNFINYLFSKGKHKEVLILGYSCSDQLDITPQIELIDKNLKRVFFIQHSDNKEKIESIQKEESKNPFEKFNKSHRIYCNTDNIISALWKRIIKEPLPLSDNNKIETKEAKPNWQKAIENWKRNIHSNNYVAGWIFDGLGAYKEAKKYFESALVIFKKIYGEEHPEVAKYLNNIGGALKELGEYKKAIEALEKALDIDKKVYGEEHLNVARDLNNIGEALRESGEYKKGIESLEKYKKAISYYEKALNIYKKVYGEEHPDIATNLNNIGAVLEALGEYEKAIEFLEKALNIYKKIYGEEYPDIATNLNNIGAVLRKLEKYDEAIEYLEKALDIDKKVYGEEHPNIARTLNNIGMVWFKLEEYKEALGYLEESLKICMRFLGENHPDTKNVKKGIGIVKQKLNN
ncbi:MAG: tetratricopeptide repeat protein [Deltaproteobacteria bacterium]|nr:tetratricopeptide repeat protein [Deltaproteobacteria bacterium]